MGKSIERGNILECSGISYKFSGRYIFYTCRLVSIRDIK